MSARRLHVSPVLMLVCALGCVPIATHAESSEPKAIEVLADLEPAFQSFIAIPLEGHSPAHSLDRLETAINEMVDMSRAYLDVVIHHSQSSAGMLAMLRIAELHLDLAARARMISPPVDASVDEAQAFYEIVEFYATPLQETGIGVLLELDKVGPSISGQSPWLARAQLYLVLHAPELKPTLVRKARLLQREVKREARFAAPHSLLEPAHLAPRAASALP